MEVQIVHLNGFIEVFEIPSVQKEYSECDCCPIERGNLFAGEIIMKSSISNGSITPATYYHTDTLRGTAEK